MSSLLFIERSLQSIQTNQYLNENTDSIIFDTHQTYDHLLSLIQEEKKYTNVGIFSHGNRDRFTFIENITNQENVGFKRFLEEVKSRTGFENLDLFACFFGNQLGYLSTLEELLSINIRASTNVTGNSPFGDWIMETDNINIKNIYFNDAISNFKDILYRELDSWWKSNIINEIQDGKSMICSNYGAFAALTSEGKVITWGALEYGGYLGDSSSDPASAASRLNDLYGNNGKVLKIYSTEQAFAALTSEGKVITWGYAFYGGSLEYPEYTDETLPTAKSKLDDLYIRGGKVLKIYSALYAFAALTSEGKVITWGWELYGGYLGDSSITASAEYKLTTLYDNNGKVLKIYSTEKAFAALTSEGKVITWGHEPSGGSLEYPPTYTDGPPTAKSKLDELYNRGGKVLKIYSTAGAFAALTSEGKVITWGWELYGSDSRNPNGGVLENVIKIYSTRYAFAALKNDGSVVTWGDSRYGGHLGEINDQNSAAYKLDQLYSRGHKVLKIYSNNQAFAALTSEGKVITWRNAFYGGSLGHPTYTDGTPTAESKLDDLYIRGGKVLKIYSNQYAFAALTSEGKVITWGALEYGGDSSTRTGGELENVIKIYSTREAFAALTSEEKVITWGTPANGGNLDNNLTGVIMIYSTIEAFAALKSDGNVFTWGGMSYNDTLQIDINNTVDITHLTKNELIKDEFTGDTSDILEDYPEFAFVLIGGITIYQNATVPIGMKLTDIEFKLAEGDNVEAMHGFAIYNGHYDPDLLQHPLSNSNLLGYGSKKLMRSKEPRIVSISIFDINNSNDILLNNDKICISYSNNSLDQPLYFSDINYGDNSVWYTAGTWLKDDNNSTPSNTTPEKGTSIKRSMCMNLCMVSDTNNN